MAYEDESLQPVLQRLLRPQSPKATMSTDKEIQELVKSYRGDLQSDLAKYERLKDLDIFVLDNSIRESTVGQLRAHTLKSKDDLFNEVKKVGFTNIIVASFSHMTRVDDVWMKKIVDEGADKNQLWGFSEITEGAGASKVPDTEKVPVGLRKMKDAGLWNVIFEVDLSDIIYDFNKFSMDKLLNLVKKWIVWVHTNMHKNAKVVVSFRDLAEMMDDHPDRLFMAVDFLSKLPADIRPFGLAYEEPGKSMPEECGGWAKYIRKIMDNNNWKGHLLVHVHEKYGYADCTALQCLMDGADGIWASLCIEGASMGAASSTVTLMNLVRMGNKKVLKKFNCTALRKAAIVITRITTGVDPHIKQPIYGARALDFVFNLAKDEFHLADFFGEHAPVRITTLSSPEMIQKRMQYLFGEDPQFTLKITYAMKEKMLEDLKNNRKEEYMSAAGLAVLYDRAGGKLSQRMRDIIVENKEKDPHKQRLISDIREIWDTWDVQEKDQADNMLMYDSFYNGFMAPYFGCYRCADTKRALKAIDMDADGQVDWSEFCVYLKWAATQYPDSRDAQELLDHTFRQGIIPAMRDEELKTK